jgi:uncharacterized secreted protein with C-terminal beta-propeller domain
MVNTVKVFAVSMVVLVALAGALAISVWMPILKEPPINTETEEGVFKTLSSYSELVKILEKASSARYPLFFSGGLAIEGDLRVVPLTTTVTFTQMESGQYYSKTNVQVAGVDEADMVKTDGTYVYMVTYSKVVIVKAFPPNEMSIVSEIPLDEGTYILGIFIKDNKLIVMNTTLTMVYYLEETPAVVIGKSYPERIWYPNTSILIYNISDRANPVLDDKITISGSYVTSRLIENYAYIIVSMPATIIDEGETILPVINGVPINVSEIKYFGEDVAYYYTEIVVVNVDDGTFDYEVFLTGASSNIYVSRQNLYVLSIEWKDPMIMFKEGLTVMMQYLPDNIKTVVTVINESEIPEYRKAEWLQEAIMDYINSLTPEERQELISNMYEDLKPMIENWFTDKTTIYKFELDGLNINAVAKGSVPGRILDQFAMDEYGEYFRVATTANKVVDVKVESYGIYPEIKRVNNVYVLNATLDIVGALEGLAPDETIYSARYMGDYMFLVTFRRVDPLFAIDLSDPENPKVIGYVKIPGFSEYLHPYGEYLIGVGLDATEEGRITGLKISLFDVSNLSDLKEVSTIKISEELWAHSPVLGDHKAFLINYREEYIVIPVITGEEGYAYVIQIDSNAGKLIEKGRIIHQNVMRSMYIEDYIYTISRDTIKATHYGTLETVAKLIID